MRPAVIFVACCMHHLLCNYLEGCHLRQQIANRLALRPVAPAAAEYNLKWTALSASKRCLSPTLRRAFSTCAGTIYASVASGGSCALSYMRRPNVMCAQPAALLSSKMPEYGLHTMIQRERPTSTTTKLDNALSNGRLSAPHIGRSARINWVDVIITTSSRTSAAGRAQQTRASQFQNPEHSCWLKRVNVCVHVLQQT